MLGIVLLWLRLFVSLMVRLRLVVLWVWMLGVVICDIAVLLRLLCCVCC